ncbi:MAG: site-specific integrase [Candidatus Bathyarchaeota archaeon]
MNLWDSNSVKRFIAGSRWSTNYKALVEFAYYDFCRFNGFEYEPTHYPKESKIPYVPLEKDIDELIVGFKNSKYLPLIQLLKESGFRPEEGFRLTSDDVDVDTKIVTLNCPAKHSLPRQFKMSDRLLAMMLPLIRKTPHKERLWGGTGRHIKRNFALIRNRTAKELCNPRLHKVTLGSLRHFYATKLYSQTKDVIFVQQRLGHKNIQNTMVYINLVNFSEDDSFTVKVGSTLEECTQLLEAGFTYVTDYEDKKLFKKRK